MTRVVSLVAVLGWIAGCDVLNLPCIFLYGSCPTETGSAKLVSFESEQDLLDYFRQQINARNDGFNRLTLLDLPAALEEANAPTFGADDQAGLTAGDAAPAPQDGSFSQTTIQEAGVDEADVVKTDGEFAYIISGNRLRIVRLVPATDLAKTAEVELEGYGQEMYLRDDRVITLTSEYGGPVFFGGIVPDIGIAVDAVDAAEATGEGVAADSGATEGEPDRDDAVVDDGLVAPDESLIFPVPTRPRTIVTILDTSDPANPTVVSKTSFDGSIASSRMIGGMLYLVIANYEYYIYESVPALNQSPDDVTDVDVQSLLPKYARVDADQATTEGMVLTWEDLQRPTDPDGYGVVSVISMDVDAGGTFQAKGIVAEPGLVYSSTEALYLTDTNYDYFGTARETTDLYKFAYQQGQAVPVASGTVPGRILNQYSMSEYNGFLRLATTVSPEGFLGDPHNDVYVLAQQGQDLAVVGSVQGIAPRETIQSARFIGDRGFVVTFEQIDPFFTLDLSDPTNPRVVGELKVPGFSTFILPMDEDHLLTVGQYIPEQDPSFFRPWGVQLSIFDVTDFANPVRTHNLVIGDETGAYSEALYNPKAFTYFAEAGLVGLPVSIYENYPVFFDDVVLPTEPDGGIGGAEPGDAGDAVPAEAETPVVDAGETTPPADVRPPVDTGETIVPDGDTGVPDGDTDVPVVADEPPPDVIGVPPFVERGGFDGLIVYRVSTDGGFTEQNRISLRFDEAGYYYGGSFTRGVFIGDSVFAVSDLGIRAATVGTQEATTAELFLGSPFDDVFDGPIILEGDLR